MHTIDKVVIEEFWGDKKVTLPFKSNVNFLIGVNGSGKTTIINLIAAVLNADFPTLDRIQFRKITIHLNATEESRSGKGGFIEVEKSEQKVVPYPKITFRIKTNKDSAPKEYHLDLLEREQIIRYSQSLTGEITHRIRKRAGEFERDVHVALRKLVSVSWLSIHRSTNPLRAREERNFESTIDQKIIELSNDLVKYLSALNKKYTDETEKFQQYIFESLIDTEDQDDIFRFSKEVDVEKEKQSLREIFLRFRLNENIFGRKLSDFFSSFNSAVEKVDNSVKQFTINDIGYILGAKRIHSVVQEWSKLLEMQRSINAPKNTFIEVINGLLQRKHLVLSEKNELLVETQSGKSLPLFSLSSGEKQLLIILGQSLLQESNVHIYIADEPELSLHVEWQESLVSSLKSINPNSQIIFATHSPDIVGKYDDCVIRVEQAIK